MDAWKLPEPTQSACSPSRVASLTHRYAIQDIRTLVGHKTDLAQVKVRPAVRLEKGDE